MNVKDMNDSIQILFRKKSNVEISDDIVKMYELSISSDDLVISPIRDNYISEEKWNAIKELGEVDGKFEVLLLRKYVLEFDECENAFEKVNHLFTPNFENSEFCISRIHFFIDKEYTYSVELDYNFENILEVEVSHFISNYDVVKKCSEEFQVVLEDICTGLTE